MTLYTRVTFEHRTGRVFWGSRQIIKLRSFIYSKKFFRRNEKYLYYYNLLKSRHKEFERIFFIIHREILHLKLNVRQMSSHSLYGQLRLCLVLEFERNLKIERQKINKIYIYFT